MGQIFKLKSDYEPAGDQPEAIASLMNGLKQGFSQQTLLGVTGSGKTFTVANVIVAHNKPVLVVAHNKTLAAQLAQEYRDFFPDAAVHYFVSYYDYYQPEAYLPGSDTYIEKDASINEEIDRLRHASTQALLTRRDVIIVASVSCIYGLGNPSEYLEQYFLIKTGDTWGRQELLQNLVSRYYERTTADLKSGTFRAIGNSLEIMPPSEKEIYQLELIDGKIGGIKKLDAISRAIITEPKEFFLFPAKHFITPADERRRAVAAIKEELAEQLKKLERVGLLLEAERLKRRTNYDLAMIAEVGYTNGIENYSRHLSGRSAGAPPDTLLSYYPSTTLGTGPRAKKVPDFLTIIDESHVTLPQLAGMYAGDQSRKKTLVEYGFRLPSALDNRPLRYEEFVERVGQVIYTSATPGELERRESKQIVEQIIRPTGLVDPALDVRPVTPQGSTLRDSKVEPLTKYPGQVQDFIIEAGKEIKQGGRVIATTLTKKMAEDLAAFLRDKGFKAEYLHSEIKTLERIKILTDFRKGEFDCLIGVNLLREGLDLPEVSFIGILDADKEGFLRSETSLVQTIGRAARNAAGRVILYADTVTGSMERAMGETNRRRTIQLEYNKKHKIIPQTIKKRIHDITENIADERHQAVRRLLALDQAAYGKNIKKLIKEKEKQMNEAVKNLDFETAALIRDELKELVALK
ncbi:MAG: excinuclease ABC subunit B [Candidatus Vogelbacteria bacterium CG10_big_fil_rev_8_21_14_0_10_50_13]|uniref:UvrABC system protein B n=1 Tax=Candidatus Vogelbacteria bacterium CG10_big_fil_rev_8_21_14_0_10_50_13 TaxID=1975044 RepID=A0A2H0RG13_9BACT|nr:MAG: excinuclease ABC subunit B [Candidatus Vogelbacteria bacterium CG10_big_fil_rev_8_21_14_0_10_50_13]